ncbi:hypothetical protein [Falsiroseomonas selenitidurans]|uniref:Uncharacterized protein n=1 Tax=Falsiroseomonas selenitidurans TaxID=2716335 RepID=A0ABX1E0C5_9PROT|nr:hypothetical protein [Falsiroseomonas selenitidurans]NKC30601.1 hypothetical protein [Falsiroseomonas selenitidurans]OYW10637.1 MAG: hypothetical protein B7Z53_00490 [Rhodospirillales bacterium 12-71-4]
MKPDTAALVLDSVTQLGAGARGRVACCASHGGVYAAWYAARLGLAGLVLHDAGIGREEAGIGGLAWLAHRGVPAAAVAHDSARIGDGADMLARGLLSSVNAPAAALGLAPGMAVGRALGLLQAAGLQAPAAPGAMDEARRLLSDQGPVRVVALDSNGLVGPGDAGQIVVTGSHGGLLGGRAATAVKADVLAALYNDAGIGIDRAGLSRLPALDARGIAGATVSCFSARIGDAMSSWQDGYVSAVNATARARGGRIGQSTRDLVARILESL